MIRSILIALIFTVSTAFAQDWTDVISADYTSDKSGFSQTDVVTGIAESSDGYIYVTGYFMGRLVLGSDTLLSLGQYDFFLTKMAKSGSILWARSGGNSHFDISYGVAATADKGCVITGQYYNSIQLGSHTVTSSGNSDAFIAKIDEDGAWQWLVSGGGSGYDRTTCITVDASGHIFTGGMFQQSASFGSDTHAASAMNDAIIWSLESDGSHRWSQDINSSQNLTLTALTTQNDTTYAVGSFSGSATFNSLTLNPSGNIDAFLAMANQNGTWRKVQKLGGSGNEFPADVLMLDNSLYVTGSFEATMSVNTDVLSSAGYSDIFLAKANNDLSWQWGIRAGGSSYESGSALAKRGSNIAVAATFKDVADFNGQNFISNGGDDIAIFEVSPSKSWIRTEKIGSTANDKVSSLFYDTTGDLFIAGETQGKLDFGSHRISSIGMEDGFVSRKYSSGSWAWAKQYGGFVKKSIINDVAIHNNKSKYVIGEFFGTMAIEGNTLTSQGMTDIFIGKFNESGSLVWLKQAGGEFYDYGSGIALDSSGNLYVCGSYDESADFGGSQLTSSGFSDAFIAKLDTNGNWLWRRSAGGTFDDRAAGVCASPQGKIYLTGSFYEQASFGSLQVTGEGYDDIFIAALDASGSWQWVRQAGGEYVETANGVKSDSDDNALIFGSFEDKATFGLRQFTSKGFDDIFISKVSPAGVWLWTNVAGGPGLQERINDITIDETGIYAVGSFSLAADFASTKVASFGDADAFIAKLNNNGIWQWVRSFGGSKYDNAMAIDIDIEYNLYISGVFSDNFMWQSNQFVSEGKEDIYLIKTDTLANIIWSSFAGGEESDLVTSLALQESNIIYLSGQVFGNSAFGINEVSNASILDAKAFLARNEFRPLPDWDVKRNTGSSAIIRVPLAIAPGTGAKKLSKGDAVGLFYKSNNASKCAGYGIWNNEDLEITVWGNDASTPEKDGFTSGESYNFMIWDAQTEENIYTKVRYASGPEVFRRDSLTIIESMPAVWDSLHIQLKPGWNTISSNVKINDSSMDSVFRAYQNKFLIVKNQTGKLYVPLYGIKSLSKLGFIEAYDIYSTANFVLSLAGEEIDPNNQPVYLSPGWNYISYMRQNAMDIATALASISGKVLLMKDGDGKLYVPDLNIDFIGMMMAGKGYKVYMKQSGTLLYPAN